MLKNCVHVVFAVLPLNEWYFKKSCYTVVLDEE